MVKDELYKLIQEGLKEIEDRKTRKFEEVSAMRQKDRKDRIREMAFDESGVFAQSDTLTLRKILETDKEDYLNLYRVKESYVNLFDRPEYNLGDALWNDFNSDGTINTIIIRNHDGAFCGFCGLQEYKVKNEPELSIELGREFQRQGIGYEALKLLMQHYSEITGNNVFISKVSHENLASQKLMRKLGGKPDGVAKFPGIPESVLKIMEEDGEEPTDDLTLKLAEEFSTTPRKLKSHVLMFRLEYDV